MNRPPTLAVRKSWCQWCGGEESHRFSAASAPRTDDERRIVFIRSCRPRDFTLRLVRISVSVLVEEYCCIHVLVVNRSVAVCCAAFPVRHRAFADAISFKKLSVCIHSSSLTWAHRRAVRCHGDSSRMPLLALVHRASARTRRRWQRPAFSRFGPPTVRESLVPCGGDAQPTEELGRSKYLPVDWR